MRPRETRSAVSGPWESAKLIRFTSTDGFVFRRANSLRATKAERALIFSGVPAEKLLKFSRSTSTPRSRAALSLKAVTSLAMMRGEQPL